MEPSAEWLGTMAFHKPRTPTGSPKMHTEPCTGEAEQESKCKDSVWKGFPRNHLGDKMFPGAN